MKSGLRRAIGAFPIMAIVVVALAAVVRRFPDSYPTGDGASLSLHIIAALHGRARLGPYSQFGWSHPGPLLFYVLAPLYWLTGDHEMSPRATALLLNAGSLAWMLYLARRYASATVAVLTAAAMALMELRAGGDMMFSAWNPHVTLLPMAALIVTSAAVWTGAIGLLPVVALLASFIAQCHVGFVPLSTALVLIPLFPQLRRPRQVGLTRALMRTAGLLALVWLPPILEQLLHRPGNFVTIVRYFLQDDRASPTPRDAGATFCRYYLLPFLPGAHLPVGWRAEATRSLVPGLAVIVFAGATVVAAVRVHATNRFLSALAALSTMVSVVALLSVFAIRGGIADYMVFWICVPALLSVVAVAGSAVNRVTFPAPSAFAVSMVAWGIAAILIAVSADRFARWQRSAALDREPLDLYNVIDEEMIRNGATSARVTEAEHSWEQVVGVVLLGAKHGRHLTVSPGFVHVVGDDYAPIGNERITFVVFDPYRDRRPAAQFLRVGSLAIATILDREGQRGR